MYDVSPSFYGAFIEIGKNHWRHAEFPQSSKQAEHQQAYSANVMGPGQIIGDIYTLELETLDHFHFSTSDTDWIVHYTMRS